MIQALQHGNYYHIYNRGINSETLFKEKSNYKHFLKLFELHIEPIAETFAWCLMKNHFHFIAVAADKKSYDIYLRNEDRILKVTREKFRTVQKSYYDNPGFFIHQGYNADGTAKTSRLKSKPYNPIELE